MARPVQVAGSAAAAVLDIRGARASYDGETFVLDGVDLRLTPGEVCVLLGPSGSGKSTLLRSICGLAPLADGTVSVDGIGLTRQTLRQVRRRLGFVHQAHGLIGRLSAAQNVMAGAAAGASPLAILARRYPADIRSRARDLLEQVGIGDALASRPVRTLSGGQCQRVGLARALVRNPPLVLADEPVASLDPVTARDVLALLRDLAGRQGASVLCSLHQVDHARVFADRIIALGQGRILFDGPPESLTPAEVHRIYAAAERR